MIATITRFLRPVCVGLLFVGLVLVTLFGLTSASRADGVLYAAPSATGSDNCSNWANACTLQTALATALSGDQIWVQAGVHKPGAARTDSFALKSGVEVYGGFAGSESDLSERDWQTNLTVLSGDIDNNDLTDPAGVVTDTANIVGSNSYHVVSAGSNVTDTANLDGFVVTAGLANGSGNNQFGGGMLNISSSPTVNNVDFVGNRTGYGGGGMYNSSSTPKLVNVTFDSNQAYIAGAMYNDASSPNLSNVRFDNNKASTTGGMHNINASSPALTDVTFSGNSSTSGDGGGLSNRSSSNPSLTSVTFYNNTSDGSGGGIVNYSSSPTLTNVSFVGNSAQGGGGMHNATSNPLLVNVVFSGNTSDGAGGGMGNNRSNPMLINVTFSNNRAGGAGGGMSNYLSTPTLTNVIVWGNHSSLSGHDVFNNQSSPVVSYSIIGSPDPCFMDADGADDTPGTLDDDLRLLPDSPAIDAGDNSAVPGSVTTDLNGVPRFVDVPFVPDTGNGTAPIVDKGAYEASFAVTLAKAVSPAAMSPGGAITFTASVTNSGSLPAHQVVLTDTFPAFLSVSSVVTNGLTITDTGYISPYVWTVQDLAPAQGGVITITGVLTAPLAAGVYTNTAVVAHTVYAWTMVSTDSVTYTVSNIAPIFTSTPITTATQNALYIYDITTDDMNGDALTTTAPTLPAWLILSDHGAGAATLSGTPANAEVGDHSVLLRVTDSGGLTDTQAFSITVANVNEAPAFTSTPVTTATQEVLYTYAVTAADLDLIHGDALTITAPTLPAWLILSDHGAGAATLSGTPANAEVGDHSVLLRVTDSGGLTDTQSFAITVTEQPRFRVYLPIALEPAP